MSLGVSLAHRASDEGEQRAQETHANLQRAEVPRNPQVAGKA